MFRVFPFGHTFNNFSVITELRITLPAAPPPQKPYRPPSVSGWPASSHGPAHLAEVSFDRGKQGKLRIFGQNCPTGIDRLRHKVSDHVDGDGRLLFEQIVKMDLEGIVCKRKDSLYRVTKTALTLLDQGQKSPL
jgi:hypothetical protein